MSGTSVESAHGLPEPPSDIHSSDAPGHHYDVSPVAVPADSTDTTGSDVGWVNSELHTISSTIEELQSRLEEANTRLANAAQVETTEVDIGRLFVEAQRFSENSLSNLELQIHGILCEAEAKARQILTEATEEALAIRRRAQEAAVLSTRSAQELQSAIAGFTTVNTQLLQELGELNSMLAPAHDRRTNQIESASVPPVSD
jgi:cell division septum initiation protein DivIVA